MQVFIVLYLLALGIVALLAQMILPVIFPFLDVIGFGSALVPLVVIYASLELGDERAPILAAFLGTFLDLTSSHHLGTSILVLFSLSALIVTQAVRPESHTWPFRLIFVLVGTFAFFLMDYVLDSSRKRPLVLAAGGLEQNHLRLAAESVALPLFLLSRQPSPAAAADGNPPTNSRNGPMLADDIRVQGWRLGILALLVFAAIGMLLSRLWNVQVVNSDSARARSEEQTTVRQRIAPARGAICDRNGVMLAENRPSFDIDFYLGELRRAYAESHKGNVPRRQLHVYFPLDGKTGPLKIGTEASTRIDFPQPITDWTGDSTFTEDPKANGPMLITVHKGEKTLMLRASNENATADLTVTCGDKSYDLKLAADTDAPHAVTFYPPGQLPPKAAQRGGEDDIVEIVRQSIAPIKDTLGLTMPIDEKTAKDIREHFRTDPDLPYHYMSDLDFATVANFEERNLGVSGITIAQNPARQYTYGAFAAHIFGYVGKADNQNEHLASDGTPYETIGRHGIEAIMDDQLQGEPGSKV